MPAVIASGERFVSLSFPFHLAVAGPFHLRDVSQLTGQERNVAELAARSLSNPQIAQTLFVTRKTVETHLGHAYQKLDISSRTELAAALGERPIGPDEPAGP